MKNAIYAESSRYEERTTPFAGYQGKVKNKKEKTVATLLTAKTDANAQSYSHASAFPFAVAASRRAPTAPSVQRLRRYSD